MLDIERQKGGGGRKHLLLHTELPSEDSVTWNKNGKSLRWRRGGGRNPDISSGRDLAKDQQKRRHCSLIRFLQLRDECFYCLQNKAHAGSLNLPSLERPPVCSIKGERLSLVPGPAFPISSFFNMRLKIWPKGTPWFQELPNRLYTIHYIDYIVMKYETGKLYVSR